MHVILLLTIIIILYGAWEYRNHQRNLRAIPIRIHVNGTRGKSSVTRLIAAALRAGGIRTFAKTTGTIPRIIDDRGYEVPILRPHLTNIIEQVKVIRYMRKRKPQAVILECMAVQPEYQWICEHRMLKSTIGVLTNARPDHLREMGPTQRDVTCSLMNSLPKQGVAFTAEQQMFSLIEGFSRKHKLEIHQVHKESLPREILNNFDHLEYRENVALALAVARHLDIPEETALDGMYKVHPDAGALRLYRVQDDGKRVRFINALAANDPESTLSTWHKVRQIYPDPGTIIVLLNTRADRFDRSLQLLEMTADNIMYDYVISIGEKTTLLAQHYRHCGIERSKIIELGLTSAEAVYKKVFEITKETALVLAVGNMGAGGMAVADYFRQKSALKEKKSG
ncbi:poly-gamma-glutamate synthase PgsB [candidate division LCP-89 bacterium B3_LCP]|uniref:Poly-gamma-glutamate synthase PgsB n=1 Tax=candidate division LCP-89 bacterium B3_LCP TaxID=2012998 RepID=A0A532V3U6_UNCL8|nr:MAG: poly-gamma-glutamate synthase PgsB [candidate division LCP-89 bacterium B3_LCP]